jgi:hypothetical protein
VRDEIGVLFEPEAQRMRGAARVDEVLDVAALRLWK